MELNVILSETGKVVQPNTIDDSQPAEITRSGRRRRKSPLEETLARHRETERLQSLEIYRDKIYLRLGSFMKQHHGSTICETIAVLLLGIQMTENFFTLMDDLSAWNFFHKSFITIVGMHCAYTIFYQMAIWSNVNCSSTQGIRANPSPAMKQQNSNENKRQYYYSALGVLFKQLPLPWLTLAAVFHSIAGVYFFYRLTGFVRHNFLKDRGWYAYTIGYVDIVSVLVVFLWLRWALVFYTHEANTLQNNERRWRKILSIRWKYAAQCTCGLSLLLMGAAFLKLIHGVPYLRFEPISTIATAERWWLLQITAVISITLLSCFPHALCQAFSSALSVFGFVYISASEAEIHSEVYAVLYLLVPGAMAIGVLVYHALFSPGFTEWIKIFCKVISLLMFFLMLAVVDYERKYLASGYMFNVPLNNKPYILYM